MNGKQLTASILFALVLLTLVLIPLSTQQSNGTYDPWLDYNGDGKIDVSDLHPLGQAYGTSGDPTRDVKITNWPLDAEGNLKVNTEQHSRVIHLLDAYGPCWLPGGGGYQPILTPIYVGNYSTIFVYLKVTDVSPNMEGNTTAKLWYLRWMPDTSYQYYFDEIVDKPSFTLWLGSTPYAYAEYPIKAPYVEIGIYVNTTRYVGEGQATLWLWVYLRNQ